MRGDYVVRVGPRGFRGVVWGGGVNTGLLLMIATVQGVWWMRSWWCPQSRSRLFRLVGPPSAQCQMWWASAQPSPRPRWGNRCEQTAANQLIARDADTEN